jgi:hypothetical protein
LREAVELVVDVVQHVVDAPQGPPERVALVPQEAELRVRAEDRPHEGLGRGDDVHHCGGGEGTIRMPGEGRPTTKRKGETQARRRKARQLRPLLLLLMLLLLLLLLLLPPMLLMLLILLLLLMLMLLLLLMLLLVVPWCRGCRPRVIRRPFPPRQGGMSTGRADAVRSSARPTGPRSTGPQRLGYLFRGGGNV